MLAGPGGFGVEVVGIATFTTTNPGATLVFLDTATAQRRLLGKDGAATSISVEAAPGVTDAEVKRRLARVPALSGYELRTAGEEPESDAADLGSFLDVIKYVMLGFAGVATMIGPTLLANVGTDALAQLACILAAICYAFAAVWARRFRRMGISPMSVTTGQLTAGALMMLPMAMLIDQPWTQPLPPATAMGAIVALALLCTALGYVLYFRLIDSAGATNALLVTLLVPPFAIVFGSLFLNEVLAPQDFFGLALIALGLAAIDGRLLRRLGFYREVTSAR